MAKWVRLKKHIQDRMEPERSIYQKIADGYYRLGIHYRYDPAMPKIIWMNQEAIDEWLDKSPLRGG